jgi:hypothetical protein
MDGRAERSFSGSSSPILNAAVLDRRGVMLGVLEGAGRARKVGVAAAAAADVDLDNERPKFAFVLEGRGRRDAEDRGSGVFGKAGSSPARSLASSA